MGDHSLARTRTVEEEHHLKALIETMQRDGCSEQEIVARIRRETAGE
jgi:hypothetical protein